MSSIYKNGIIISGIFSNDYPVMDMDMLITDDKAIFARILHHNNHEGTVLFTPQNVLNIQTENLYSRLYLMEEFRNNSGGFEFIVLQHDNVTYRWKQTSNPCTETTCTGYENISNTYKGIKKTSDINADKAYIAIDGSAECWQSIGAYVNYSISNIDGILGWASSENNVGESAVNPGTLDFYVRCDNIKNLKKFSIYDKAIISNEFYEI